jgi:hypothetical protein
MTARSSARPRSSPLVPDERVVCSSSSSIGTSTHRAADGVCSSQQEATTLAASTAFELVRTALVAKLAVDLGDPVLARRAARYAQSSARLLGGLDFPAEVDEPQRDVEHLPEVDDLLERMPSRREVEQ